MCAVTCGRGLLHCAATRAPTPLRFALASGRRIRRLTPTENCAVAHGAARLSDCAAVLLYIVQYCKGCGFLYAYMYMCPHALCRCTFTFSLCPSVLEHCAVAFRVLFWMLWLSCLPPELHGHAFCYQDLCYSFTGQGFKQAW